MYYFFLGLMQLPVAPSKMAVKVNSKNKKINLINEGEVNLIKSPGLSEVSFDIRLPNSYYPWANYDSSLMGAATSFVTGLVSKHSRFLNSVLGNSPFSFKKSEVYLNQLEQYKKSKIPFRFIVTRMKGMEMLFSTNMLVTLENYSVEEDARRDGFDVTVPVTLRQYRPFGTKTAHMETDKDGNKTVVVDEPRESLDVAIPNAIDVTNQMSVFEAVKQAVGGNLDWRAVMEINGIGNPIQDIRGTVLNLK